MRTGRFAPSPTGDLHAGSLVAALASRCDAARWRVRIDDVDPPREVPGSAARILAALVDHGFPGADAPAERQSAHGERYREALEALAAEGLLFACACTRRELGGAPGCVGRCRGDAVDVDRLAGLLAPDAPRGAAGVAVRARLGGALTVTDRVLGTRALDLDRLAPDATVLRRDGWFAYHLATAVDDARGIDDVVRGADLLEATGVQRALMAALGARAPTYAHVPVALGPDGAKLAKGAGAARLEPTDAVRSLRAAWRFLGQRPLGDEAGGGDDGGRDGRAAALERFWSLAPARWRMADVPAVRERPWAGAAVPAGPR